MPSTLTMPNLRESMPANKAWLVNHLSEERYCQDTGNPPGDYTEKESRWLDIHVPYVPKAQRTGDDADTTMVELIKDIGDRKLWIYWIE